MWRRSNITRSGAHIFGLIDSSEHPDPKRRYGPRGATHSLNLFSVRVGDDNWILADGEAEAIAAGIVAVVDAHDALVDACRDALEDVTGPITHSGIKIRYSTREKLEVALALAAKPSYADILASIEEMLFVTKPVTSG